jgi:broad specificity phosphatase PhoE
MKILLLLVAMLGTARADDALWERLGREKDLVVLMRHAQPAGGDPLAWDESGHCAGESMLTAPGKAHAARIGAEFTRRGIKPVVISSPMCRCRDTAQLAFGVSPLMDRELREVATADGARMARFEQVAQGLIARHRGAAPVVVVTHRPNIDRLSMELVDSGDLVIARSDARGELEVLGKIRIPEK